MGEAEQRIAALSPEQRELLLRRLREKAAPRDTATAREIPRIPSGVDRHQPVPLTPIQEAYWIGRSGIFDLGGCGANVYIEHELTGSVWTFAPALETAVRSLVERHEMLRAVVLADGTLQVLAKVPPFEVQVEDLSSRRAEHIERILEDVREDMRYARRPIDVWPLFEILVHQLPAGKISVHARFDGILIDGLGRNLIIEELTRLVADPEAALPNLEISFLDYARALAEFRDSATYRRAREYWMAKILSMPAWPVLPRAREISPATVPRMVRREQVLLPIETWERLKQRAARLNLSPTGILTAAFAEHLRRGNPEPDFTLAVEATYRPPVHPQITSVVGNFATFTLLGIEADLGVSFAERAQRLQQRMTEDMENLDFSGHDVLRELNKRWRVGCHAVVPVVFDSVVEFSHTTYHNGDAPADPNQATALGSVAVDMVRTDLRISLPQVLLLVVVRQAPDGAVYMITQEVAGVMPDGFVEGFIAGYAELLERLANQEELWAAKALFPISPLLPKSPGPSAVAAPPSPSPAAASWTPVETELAGLWEEILGQRPETPADGFFDLGGDSLLATRLVARVRERFALQTPLHDFLFEPTLAGMARAVERGLAQSAAKASLWSRLTSWLRPGTPETPAANEGAAPRRGSAHGMRIFLTLWIGQLASSLGTGLGSFALGVWIFEKTGSATQFAMIGFIVGVTVLLVSPIAGTLADRWDRRRLLIVSDLGSGLITLLMASLLLTDLLQPWHVYPIVTAMVALAALQGPALTSSISLLVPREHLARASGMTQMSRSIAQILGPLIAGALVGRIGYHGVVYIDAASFLLALTTVLLVRIPSPPGASQTGRRSLFRDFAFGWSYLRSRAGLFALLGLYAVTNFSMGMVQTLLTPLILSFATPLELGTVNSAAASGVLLGSLALAVWGGPGRRTLTIFSVLLAQGALLFLGGAEPSVPLIAVATFFFMITVPVINACNQVILQRKVAPEVQGRVFAMAGIITSCTVPLAALAAGPLADQVFEPALAPGGALADSLGRLVGVGPGRGIGLLFMTLGAFVIIVACLAFLNPRLRRVETELPDEVHPATNGPAARS